MVSESAHKVVRPKDIENKLKSALSTTFLRLKDVSSCNCGQKFEAVIVSPKFEGMSLQARQRLVFSVVKEEMKVIHSFTQQTLTPNQWRDMQHDQEQHDNH